MRFGRIPKREKQRLMDEMQSYMNSLNGPASMEMDVPPPSDAPCSLHNQTTTGAISLSQSYPSEEKPPKMAEGNSILGSMSFQTGTVQEASPSAQNLNAAQHRVQQEQLNVSTSYHLAANFPAPPCSNASSTSTNVSNANYSFSSNKNQCPVSGSISSKTFTASRGVIPESYNQNSTSCPWKLNGGAKVLVSLDFVLFKINTNQFSVSIMISMLIFVLFLLSVGVPSQFMSRGSGQSLQSGGVGVVFPMLHPSC